MIMRTHSILFALASTLMLALTACEQNTPLPEEQFPKKQLIEEFTGQDCGWCPLGMNYIHDFVSNDTNWIVVLHHDGYQKDHFTVSGSSTIARKLSVNGAPSMALNRTKTQTGEGKLLIFHPAYLADMQRSNFETTTYASIGISNNYDAESRTLRVHVDGRIGKDDYPALKLTVLVKESGMIDYQADYNDTYEGWKEFRHTNAVRAFMTAAFGDTITIDKKRAYSSDYVLTLNENWVAENCMVVAFLSEGDKPVVQAEQRPVVAGSKGGADIKHGGITKTPVPDYYPEPGATTAPADYSKLEADTMTTTVAGYQSAQGIKLWTIMTYNENEKFLVGNTNCIPFAYLYVITSANESNIANGTYEINNSFMPGSVYAGYRNDRLLEIDGSTLYYTSLSYFNNNYLVPSAQWLITDGSMTITDEGYTLDGHARNGAEIHLVGSTPIINQGRISAPQHQESAPANMPMQRVIKRL